MAHYTAKPGADPACDPATQVRMPHYAFGVTGDALQAPITMVDPALVHQAVDEAAHVPLGAAIEQVLREDPPPDVTMNPSEPVTVGGTFAHETYGDGSTKATETSRTPGGCDPSQHFNITNTLAAGAAILSAVKRDALMQPEVTLGTEWRQNNVTAQLSSKPRMFKPCDTDGQAAGIEKLPVGALMYVHGCVLLRDPKCPAQVDTGYLKGVYAFHVGHGVVATCLRGRDVSPDHDTWAAVWTRLPYRKLCARLRKITENRMAELGMQVQAPFAATFDVSGATFTVHDPFTILGATSAYELWAPRRPNKTPAPRADALMVEGPDTVPQPEPEPEPATRPEPEPEPVTPPASLPRPPPVSPPRPPAVAVRPVTPPPPPTPRRKLPNPPMRAGDVAEDTENVTGRHDVQLLLHNWRQLGGTQQAAVYAIIEDYMDR